MKKTFQDLEFQTEFRKLAGETPSPLMPEAQEERTVPRDAESIGFNCSSLLTASPTETAPLHCIPMMRKCCIERLLRLSAVFCARPKGTPLEACGLCRLLVRKSSTPLKFSY
jgi:hypothetical protein